MILNPLFYPKAEKYFIDSKFSHSLVIYFEPFLKVRLFSEKYYFISYIDIFQPDALEYKIIDFSHKLYEYYIIRKEIQIFIYIEYWQQIGLKTCMTFLNLFFYSLSTLQKLLPMPQLVYGILCYFLIPSWTSNLTKKTHTFQHPFFLWSFPFFKYNTSYSMSTLFPL